MDKNMINIDDLVRQRLSGGEERERVGAWTNMKALLDKEMPSEPVAVGWNWRRITGYFTGLLLLATLSVGGYKGYEIVKENNLNKKSSNDASEPANGSPVASRAHADNDAAVSVKEIDQAVKNTKDNTVAGATGAERHVQTAAEDGTTAVAHQNTNNHQQTNHHTPAVTNHHSTANTTDSHTAAAPNDQIATNNNTAVAANNNVTNNATAANENGIAEKMASGQHKTVAIASANTAGKTGIKQAPEAPLKAERNISNHSVVSNNPATGNNGGAIVPQAATSNNTVTNNNNNNPNNPAGSTIAAMVTNNNTNMLRDTLKKIKLLQRFVRDNATHTLSMRIDTIAIEQQVVLTQRMTAPTAANNTVAPTPELPQVVTPPANNAIAKNTTRKSGVPAAAPATPAAAPMPAPASASADENSMLVPLANYKVSSHKSYAWDPERFQDMVRRAKFSMSQIKFYPGITGGLNASFGSYSMMGFQFGLSGVVAINDHWSILTELKYINRSNKGLSINDNYVNTTGVDSIGRYHGNQFYKVYTRTDDSVQHYFNFSILHSVELPISVRYAIGRLYLMGGLNLVYNFGVNTEEIDQHYTVKKTLDSTIYSNVLPIQTVNGKAKITTNDFASRFGLGYLVGLGYQITPAVQLDLRMTRTFWDNASSQGSKDVSNQLYKMPSFQLSVGYRFSQKK